MNFIYNRKKKMTEKDMNDIESLPKESDPLLEKAKKMISEATI
jgi:hypothetical protein